MLKTWENHGKPHVPNRPAKSGHLFFSGHNLRASANPLVVRLAVELLRDVIHVRACTSTQRLISLLMQPFSSQSFEPDPLFSEAASTGENDHESTKKEMCSRTYVNRRIYHTHTHTGRSAQS